jgi:hypothetical protein
MRRWLYLDDFYHVISENLWQWLYDHGLIREFGDGGYYVHHNWGLIYVDDAYADLRRWMQEYRNNHA